MSDIGKQTEDLVEKICTRMFFSDFTSRSPNYVKLDGVKRELADLLVLFGEYGIAFQVKSKLETKRTSEKTEVDFERINRVVNKAVDQLKTMRRAFDNNWIHSITTVRGIEIDFDPTQVKYLIGVVIIDLIGEELFSLDDRSELFGSYTYHHGFPIHVFLRDEFETLSTELDTLPDFIEFLDRVQKLYENELLILPPNVLDLLALYKMDPDEVDEMIENGVHLFADQGLWQSYRTNHLEAIYRRDELNRPSYMVDTIIDYLHSSVGFELTKNISHEFGLHGQGTVEGYLKIAKELANIPRLKRRILGQRLLRCLKLAETNRRSHSIILDERNFSAILVLSTSDRRPDRQEYLYTFCAMAYCYFNLRKIIGVATEPLKTKLRSYDFVCLEEVEFTNAAELAHQAASFFGKPRKYDGTEYTENTRMDT